jgi:hypothetical protein
MFGRERFVSSSGFGSNESSPFDSRIYIYCHMRDRFGIAYVIGELVPDEPDVFSEITGHFETADASLLTI